MGCGFHHTCMKPWKQRIGQTILAETGPQKPLAEVVAAGIWMPGGNKKAEQPKSQRRPQTDFRQVNGETHTPFDQ